MDVTDNPVVRALLQEVLKTGKEIIVFLKGTFLTVHCAATRAVLATYDVAKVPFQWLDHWWGHALDWVVRCAQDCPFDAPESLLFGQNHHRPAHNEDMSALEEGLYVTAEAEGLPQVAPASLSFQHQRHQQQCSRVWECTTRGVVSRVTTGEEVGECIQSYTSPRMQNSARYLLPRYWIFLSSDSPPYVNL